MYECGFVEMDRWGTVTVIDRIYGTEFGRRTLRVYEARE